MNWRIILLLAPFGLLMGGLTVLGYNSPPVEISL